MILLKLATRLLCNFWARRRQYSH